MNKLHAGSGKPQGTLNHGTHPRPSPVHGGSGAPKGVTHAPPQRGGAVNRGGTFGMGTLKKRK
jgi:hypothetical protein